MSGESWDSSEQNKQLNEPGPWDSLVEPPMEDRTPKEPEGIDDNSQIPFGDSLNAIEASEGPSETDYPYDSNETYRDDGSRQAEYGDEQEQSTRELEQTQAEGAQEDENRTDFASEQAAAATDEMEAAGF